MAGIGIQLNRIFEKRTVTSSVYGIAFSVNYAIGPMLVVVVCLMLMYNVLGFNQVGYVERELFSSSVLYIFIFSLLITSSFNSTLSKYVTDQIYLEKLDDVRACSVVGITFNLVAAALLGIPFYIRVMIVGEVPAYYVFTCFLAFMSLTLIFSVMIFISILKNYKKLAWFFIAGMSVAFLLSVVFRYVLHFSITYSMLLALAIGFFVVAVLEMANFLRYFRTNSHNYRGPMEYFKKYWRFAAANLLYIFGLFSHNIVFWTMPEHIIVAKSYVSNQAYDMASFMAMLTNISGTIFSLTTVEMNFRKRYAEYLNGVLNAKLDRIEEAKTRMFRTLSMQLLTLVQMQFIVSVVLFLITYALMPTLGLSGLTMRIYPLLSVGYFMCYVMYAGILFLYSFNDTHGSFIAGLLLSSISFGGSFITAQWAPEWYGAAFTLGTFVTFLFIYFRLHWLESNIDGYIFCSDTIMKPAKTSKPSDVVYRRDGMFRHHKA